MNLLGGSTLPAVAERRYDQWLYFRLAGLIGWVRTRFQGVDRQIDTAERAIAPLNGLEFARVVQDGSPFFWMNVHRLLTQDDSCTLTQSESLQHLICNTFDSYFSSLPNGHEVCFEVQKPDVILLPKLGLRIQAIPGTLRLQRQHASGVHVEADGEGIEIELLAIPEEFRLPALTIPCRHPSRLLLASHSSLFEQAYIQAVTPDTPRAERQAAMIGDALGLIGAVYPSMEERIAASVNWYVPVGTDTLDTHRSFSAANLVGLVFLSEASNDLQLAEAIVHEFHHNELFAYSHVVPLIDGASDRLFYSPWREDARPLYGLVHAIFVFAGVCDFYRCVERTPAFDRHHKHLRQRRSERVCQLDIGLAQIKETALTDSGRALIASITARVEEHRLDLAESREVPASVEKHLRKWLERYPDLASEVRLSYDLQASQRKWVRVEQLHRVPEDLLNEYGASRGEPS